MHGPQDPFSTDYNSLIRSGLIYEASQGHYLHTYCAKEFRPGKQSEFKLRTCARCAAVKMTAELAFEYAYSVPLNRSKGMEDLKGRSLSAHTQPDEASPHPAGAPTLTELLEGHRILKGTRKP